MLIVAVWKSYSPSGGSERIVPSPFSMARTAFGAPLMEPFGELTPAPTSSRVMRRLYGPGWHNGFHPGHEIATPGSRDTLIRKLVTLPVAIQTLPVAIAPRQAPATMPKLGSSCTV